MGKVIYTELTNGLATIARFASDLKTGDGWWEHPMIVQPGVTEWFRVADDALMDRLDNFADSDRVFMEKLNNVG